MKLLLDGNIGNSTITWQQRFGPRQTPFPLLPLEQSGFLNRLKNSDGEIQTA
jgi:hypothetical protein